MNWDAHRRWARKLGISDEVAEYVNCTIDCSEESNLPTGFQEDIREIADKIATTQGAKRGNSALALIIVNDVLKHDAGRRKRSRGDLATTCMLRHLREKGDDYVRAWYLHHHLDYLHERQATESDVRNLIKEYKTEYPNTHSLSIEQFLLANETALAEELTA